jgi:hypothetical protein
MTEGSRMNSVNGPRRVDCRVNREYLVCSDSACGEQDAVGRAADASRRLGYCPEPKHQLRMGAVAEPRSDEAAHRRQLKRLAVQRCRDAVGCAGQQDALERLSCVDPVRRPVILGGQQADDSRGAG